jgi:hypothetical protein
MPLSNRLCFQVNLRDKLQCQACAAKPLAKENYHQGFEYHHIVPKSQGGFDTLENIVLLCYACHQQSHQKSAQLWANLSEPIVLFHCSYCAAELNAETVEMNCGWYRCNHCLEVTHLFDVYGTNE